MKVPMVGLTHAIPRVQPWLLLSGIFRRVQKKVDEAGGSSGSCPMSNGDLDVRIKVLLQFDLGASNIQGKLIGLITSIDLQAGIE
jgi:hypothetical protein